jgi:hypothetical protein
MTDLEMLENVLSIDCPVILKNLQPGVSNEYIDKVFVDISLNFQKIKEIYSWRNGTSETTKPSYTKYSFHPFGNFMPIEEAVKVKKQYEDEGHWEHNLFPIITNYDGDFLLLDIDENSPTYGFLYISSTSMLLIPPITIYDSFTSFVKSVSNCYSSKGYRYNKKTNELEVNLEYEKVFSNAINPRSEFWKE